MADEQYSWLDREIAERLLRGESLEAVEAADRDQAERLAKTLEALTVEPALTSEELPGEAAALAAFRSVRAERDNAAVADGDPAATVGGHPARPASDAGLVRIGGPARAARRPRLGRPLRLGLAAALAVGMVGGVAVAAGTGVLPPFDSEEPAPGASVSAEVTPERPLLSPSPGNGVQGEPTPSGAPTAEGTDRHTAPGGSPTGRDSATRRPGDHSGGWRKGVTASCRDVRDGKRLPVDRRQALEGAAGGSARVWTYCKGVLADLGENIKGVPDQGKDKPKGDTGDQSGKGDEESHPGGSGGTGHGDGNGHGGNGHHTDGADTPGAASPLLSNRTAPSGATPSPSPSYSAL
jgi:hypothetical protein